MAEGPAFIGSLSLEDDVANLSVNEDVELFYEEEAIKEIELTYDSRRNPSYITHGNFAWYIMKRHHSLAIRLRDYKNPAIEAMDEMSAMGMAIASALEH